MELFRGWKISRQKFISEMVERKEAQ